MLYAVTLTVNGGIQRNRTSGIDGTVGVYACCER